MTVEEIERLGPEFAAYLSQFRACFAQRRTRLHFDNYCRGLLSDLPRKSVEPMALESGTAVRTLQAFLSYVQWDHELARDRHQQQVVSVLNEFPDDCLGRIGIIDETGHVKKGDKTPGVQRQYCGAVGKVENCIVTVHLAVVQGEYKTLLDGELYLPASWATDRERCRKAKIPEALGYRAKWEIALGQLGRLQRNGLSFDWLTFDEGYGSKAPFLRLLNIVKQRFVAEVPVSFRVRRRADRKSRRADQRLSVAGSDQWRRFRLARQTVGAQIWRAKAVRVWTLGRWHRLIAAVNDQTGEVKYFLTNVVRGSLRQALQVAFTRWNVEHLFRVAKQEVGLTHYEGRDYQGLLRHLILGAIVMGFVSRQAARLRGEKPADYPRADLPRPERALCDGVSSPTGNDASAIYQRCHPLPSAA